MNEERDLLVRAKVLLECVDTAPLQDQADLIVREITELLAQPEQEPVAWGVYYPEDDMLIAIYGPEERPNMELKERFEWIPLYTAHGITGVDDE